MKNFILFLCLYLIGTAVSKASLSEKVVREVNGDAGIITQVMKGGHYTYTFSGDLTNGTAVDLVTIPANAVVYFVGVNSRGLAMCSLSADFGVEGEQAIFGQWFFAFSNLTAPGGYTWATEKKVRMTVTGGDTSGCTGEFFDTTVIYYE